MRVHRHGGFTLTRGFTLIEVLVALFVLAVGVVGAGAAQLAAQRTRHQSALMSEAAQQAASLGARMRANAAAAGLPDSSNPYLSLDYDAADGNPGAAPASCYGASACDPLQLAAFDLHEAKQGVYAAFPGGRIAVCRDAAPWDAGTRRYRWACTAGAGAPMLIKLGWSGTGAAPGLVAVAPL
ncbi:type IV pilus modification protein PilV [Massilia sp. AB1]|uniref:type IV pilus modification protein PilV n=1 Tax=Massilia sp. AB1 TaxID=2823371 RepID=UPI001B83C98B|nr:type IV pilus modification protein PilV [Massilia sp. AB1]MBQ5942294.1 type IV pilus modification protein PilV [Massilia sp. AB1]